MGQFPLYLKTLYDGIQNKIPLPESLQLLYEYYLLAENEGRLEVYHILLHMLPFDSIIESDYRVLVVYHENPNYGFLYTTISYRSHS